MAIRAPRSFQATLWLPCLFILLLFITFTCALPPGRPRLGVRRRGYNYRAQNSHSQSLTATSSKNDYQTFYYDQPLDHFNYQPESYTTFRQRYIVNFTHWGGAKKAAPIFVYLGGESTSDDDVGSYGFMIDNARRFGGLEVYAEHRFYGQSIPHGFTGEGALKNATIRGYFNSNQALADYAELIVSLKKNLSADSSPVLVAGGSYSGELATYFRLKYPHIAMGALASSAPILYFDDLVPPNSYYVIVTQDFQEASWSCYETVKSSWSEIDRVAAKPNGLSELSKKFKTCKPLKKASELVDYLITLYSVAAQYDTPPDYPVDTVCRGIDGGANGTDILGRIFSGVVAYYGESKKCYDLGEFFSSETLDGWDWQTCNEEVTITGCGPNETMFPELSYDYKDYKDYCVDKFGVEPAPHWVTTYYGGEHIKRVLHKFGSNIIFSNGLRDPYSSGGILEDISDTLVALPTKNGSHSLDILLSRKDDPDWLIDQRLKQAKIIKQWFDKYYEDLRMFG
nr:lysosomal Pro-X carboxypeptidase-like [Quercus suber]